jgi:class 3 adenylate cyclase
VLFCDLVGFTARSDQADPEDVGALLSPHHARLRAEIERLGGTLDKFIGDAVMALFGAPVALGPGRWRPRPAPCSSGPSRGRT